MMPRVSVVISTFNRIALLPEALDSVLAQTFKHFEIIVADDGSIDGTRELLASKYAQSVRVIALSHSGVPAGPRNAGILAARAPWIAFLDSDDLWLPHKLEVQMKAGQDNHDSAIFYSLCENFDRYGSTGINPPQNLRYSGRVFDRMLFGNPIPFSTALVRRSALLEVGLFDENVNLRGVEDYELWLRMAYRHPIRLIPQVLGRYRIHDTNLSADFFTLYKNQEFVITKLGQLHAIPQSDQNRALAIRSYWSFKWALQLGRPRAETLNYLDRSLQLDSKNIMAFFCRILLCLGGYRLLVSLSMMKQTVQHKISMHRSLKR